MSLNVEFAVVGAAIRNSNAVPEILTRITPQDMFEPKAEATLKAVADLWAAGTPIDALSVSQAMSGGQVTASDVFSMYEQACLPQSLPHHVNTIADRAAVRRLSNAGHRITTLAQQGESPQIIAQHAQELLDSAVRVDESEVQAVGETLGDTIAQIQAAARGEVESGLPTGLVELDDMTKGLHGGQMVIVAARPGIGKTVLVTDFMRHATMRLGVPAMMFSLEMGKNELNQRILAAESGVNLTNIGTGKMSEAEWVKFNQAAEKVAEAPLYVDDSTGLTITDIVAKARMWVERKGVGLIVVDYLQLLRSDGRVESREQEVAAYSRQMKLLAKSCNVPVVVVSQLNRESVKRGTPMVSDLRESGALEQDADLILLIDRPAAYDPDERAGEADVIVAKNRRGRTGTVPLASQLHYSRFSNMYRGTGL